MVTMDLIRIFFRICMKSYLNMDCKGKTIFVTGGAVGMEVK